MWRRRMIATMRLRNGMPFTALVKRVVVRVVWRANQEHERIDSLILDLG